MKPQPLKNEQARRAYTERILAGISATNRPLVERFIRRKQAEGLTTSSVQNHALTLGHVDRYLNGGSIAQMTPEQIVDFFNAKRTDPVHPWGTITSWGHNTRLRHFFRFVLGLDSDDPLPKAYKNALRRLTIRDAQEEKPVTVDEFHALLMAADKHLESKNSLRVQALLWTLWDSGFRLGEAMSLRVGSVEFDGDAGGQLRLFEQTEGLKTGPRTIYVVNCLPALKAWLAAHPNGADPNAPLFPPPRGAEWREGVWSLLSRLCKHAGIRNVHPHLFRHTRATRAAEDGWIEAQMRAYFGWSMNSEMPAKYIHIASKTMKERVRKDAGLDATGKAATLNAEYATCRFCAETIKAAALKCRHCGEFLTTKTPAATGAGA